MDFAGTVRTGAAAIRKGRRGILWDSCTGDDACTVLRAARNSGVRAEGTEADV